MAKTILIKCNCSNDYQDKKYGINIRVANKCVDYKPEIKKYRCTVCTKEYDNPKVMGV